MRPNEQSVMLTPNRAPPKDYYQNNCRALFRFTLDRYADLLPSAVMADIHAFLDADDDAQRLFARLLTRRGPNIRVDSLRYSEIADVESAISDLCARDLIKAMPFSRADLLLPLLKKVEITRGWPKLEKRLRKSELIERVVGTYTDWHIHQRVSTLCRWVTILRPDSWDLMRLLYFGRESQDWATFVLRDLGVTQYEPVTFTSRQFADRKSLAIYLHYRELHRYTAHLGEHPRLAIHLLEMLRDGVDHRPTERKRNKAAIAIGKWCERAGLADLAVSAYDLVHAHPARERAVRVLAKLGRDCEVQQRLEQLRSAPLSEEELQFTERFGKRNAGFQPSTTVVDIQHPPEAVETQALGLLVADGGWGMHVESQLVSTLAGLIYWRAIFADVAGAFTNPFQLGPNDLYAPDFVQARQPVVQDIEAATVDDAEFVACLLETASQKWGVSNHLVSWRMIKQHSLTDIIDAIPVDHMRRLTHFYIRNLEQRRSGLPDLFVAYGPNEYEFVEVKGPNDQLQPGQRIWLRHLDRLGIPARVLKLRLVS